MKLNIDIKGNPLSFLEKQPETFIKTVFSENYTKPTEGFVEVALLGNRIDNRNLEKHYIYAIWSVDQNEGIHLFGKATIVVNFESMEVSGDFFGMSDEIFDEFDGELDLKLLGKAWNDYIKRERI